MTQSLTGRTVLVTGANGAIGTALTAAFQDAGATVLAAARHPPAENGGLRWVALDVTDDGSVSAAAAEWAEQVDILINNAGANGNRTFLGAPDLSVAREEMEVNYFGPLRLARAFAPAMVQRGAGVIVNILSSACFVNFPTMGSYSASKAAMWSLTQGLRAELAQSGVRVCAVVPSIVASRLTAHLDVPKLAPAEVAAAVVEGLMGGNEDIFVGTTDAFYRRLRAEPKAVERELAARLRR